MNKIDFKQISKLLDTKLDPIHGELKKNGQILKEHSQALKSQGGALKSQGQELKEHGKLLQALKKDQDTMLDMLDTEQMQQRKRLTKIEEHLGVGSSAD